MKIKLELNNKANSPVEKGFLENVFYKTLSCSGISFSKDAEIFLSVASVSPSEIKKLNLEYRKKDTPTDVLSFCEFENRQKLENFSEKEIFLGEVILCYTEIENYAQRNGWLVNQELARVFSHGVLHCLGFSHSPEMFEIQDRINVS